MSWNLTTGINGGGIADDMGEIDISRLTFDFERGMIRIHLAYGNTIGGKFVKGPTPAGKKTTVSITEQNYEDFRTANQALYNQVRSVFWAKLLADDVIDAGAES